MTDDTRWFARTERIVDEARAAREQLHLLVARLHAQRAVWGKTVADLQRRPRLTPPQRTRLRRHMIAFAHRRVR